MKFKHIIISCILCTQASCINVTAAETPAARTFIRFPQNTGSQANISRLTWTKFDDGHYDALDLTKQEWIVSPAYTGNHIEHK